MPRVLLCTTNRVLDELGQTWIMRGGIHRQFASGLQDALAAVASRTPHLVVVDRDFPQALRLLRTLRDDPKTRKLSVAALVPKDVDAEEAQELDGVCNVLLHSPVGPEWGERLGRLLAVESRREIRVPVRVEYEGTRSGQRSRITGMAHNISTSGMLVECVVHLPVGEHVDVQLTLPGSEEPLRASGQVVREQPASGSGVSCYGVAFDTLDPASIKRIRQFIESDGR
jgi:CheY-like chemotaxis protein